MNICDKCGFLNCICVTGSLSPSKIVDDALFEFWKSVAEKFPMATVGDVSFDLVMELNLIAHKAVENWIENNVKGAN